MREEGERGEEEEEKVRKKGKCLLLGLEVIMS